LICLTFWFVLTVYALIISEFIQLGATVATTVDWSVLQPATSLYSKAEWSVCRDGDSP